MNFSLRIVSFPDVEFVFNDIDRESSADEFLAYLVRRLLERCGAQDRQQAEAAAIHRQQRAAHFGTNDVPPPPLAQSSVASSVGDEEQAAGVRRHWQKVSDRIALATHGGRVIEELTRPVHNISESDGSTTASRPTFLVDRTCGEAFRELDTGVIGGEVGWLIFLGAQQTLHTSMRTPHGGGAMTDFAPITERDLVLRSIGDLRRDFAEMAEMHVSEVAVYPWRESQPKLRNVPTSRVGPLSSASTRSDQRGSRRGAGDAADPTKSTEPLPDETPLFPFLCDEGEGRLLIGRLDGVQVHVHVLSEAEAVEMTRLRWEAFHDPSSPREVVERNNFSWAARRRRREKMMEASALAAAAAARSKRGVDLHDPAEHRVFSFTCFPIRAPLNEVQDRLLSHFQIRAVGFMDFTPRALRSMPETAVAHHGREEQDEGGLRRGHFAGGVNATNNNSNAAPKHVEPVINLFNPGALLADVGDGFGGEAHDAAGTIELYAVEQPPQATAAQGVAPQQPAAQSLSPLRGGTAGIPLPMERRFPQELLAKVHIFCTNPLQPGSKEPTLIELQLPVDRPFCVSELKDFVVSERLDEGTHLEVFHGLRSYQGLPDDVDLRQLAVSNDPTIRGVRKAVLVLAVR